MADSPLKSALQKPPGYKDPNAPAQPSPVPIGRKPVLPPPFRPKKKRRHCCRTCCCILCFLILFLIVVVCLAAALFYLLFDPKLPVFHLQSFRISKFDVAAKPDGTYLSADSVMRVEFKNPNKKLSIFYNKIVYDVTVGDNTEFGERSVPGFTQGSKETTSLKLAADVKNKLLDIADGAKLHGWFLSKELNMKVNAHTAVGVVVQGWRIGPVAVDLKCDSKLKGIEGGKMPKCSINLLRWINIY